MLTFAFKKYGLNNLLSQSIVEDGKNAKIIMLEKLCLVNFFMFHKKKFSSTQILASEKPPKKYACSEATDYISLKIL